MNGHLEFIKEINLNHERNLNMTMSANNMSRNLFKQISDKMNWLIADNHRNVAYINGKKYSFSVTPDNKRPNCRQVYEDTVGFVTLYKNGLYIFPITDFSGKAVTRISSNMKKAFQVSAKKEDMIYMGAMNAVYASKKD